MPVALPYPEPDESAAEVDHGRVRSGVWLRGSRAPWEVRISDAACSAIIAEAVDWQGQAETGGLLYGHRHRSADPSITILRATGPGADAKHGATQFKVGLEPFLEMRRLHGNDRSVGGYGEIGSWHTHPGHPASDPSVTLPSEHDLTAWWQMLELLEREHNIAMRYVGLIATRGRRSDSWRSPDLHSYVVYRDRFDRMICEAASPLDERVASELRMSERAVRRLQAA